MTFRAGYGDAVDHPGRVEQTGFSDFATARDWLAAQLEQLDAETLAFTWWPYTVASVADMKAPFTFRNPDKMTAYVLEEGGNG